MQRLIEGLRQFVKTVQSDEKELFAHLAERQEPDVLFITCSDSRVAPHIMTQTQPGDLFVIRNAGNIVPPFAHGPGGEAATIEYAVAALKVRDIIVCGHSNCGAVGGLFKLDEIAEKLPMVRAWLEHCEPTRNIVEQQLGDLPPEEQLRQAIELNVLSQLSHLHSHPSVVARMDAGDLNLHGWVYDIRSGHVNAFDYERRCFVSIFDTTPGEPE